MQGVLQGIMNPEVADIAGGLRRGGERRQQNLSQEMVGNILKETIGGKLGSLGEIDPQAAIGLAEAFQIPVGQEDRIKSMFGDAQAVVAVLQNGGTPQEAAQLLAPKVQLLESLGIEPTQYIETMRGLNAGDPETIEGLFTLVNVGQNAGFLKSPQAAGVQSSEILEDGTTIQVLKDGSTKVTDAEGNDLKGEARREAIAEARRIGIENQRERALGRREGTTEADRRSSLIDRGVLAAESTSNLRRSLDLLNKIETGGVNAISLAVKNRLGIEGADEGELTNSLAKAVLSQLRETFGAQFTAREGDELKRIEAGIGKSTEANRRVISNSLKFAETLAQRGLRAAKRAGDDDTAQDIQDLLDFRLTPEEEETPQTNVGRFQIEVIE